MRRSDDPFDCGRPGCDLSRLRVEHGHGPPPRHPLFKRRLLDRKRYSNGVIIGVRRGEWWIGVQNSLQLDAVVIGLLGLTLMIPKKIFWHWRIR